MVPGFVEHEKVRIIKQRQGQRQYVLFAAGQRPQRLILDAFEAKRVEDFLCLFRPVIAIDPVVVVTGFLVRLHRGFDVVRFSRCEGLLASSERFAQGHVPGKEPVHDELVIFAFDVLWDVPDSGTGCHRHVAVARSLLAE